jgi:hypothetical protein
MADNILGQRTKDRCNALDDRCAPQWRKPNQDNRRRPLRFDFADVGKVQIVRDHNAMFCVRKPEELNVRLSLQRLKRIQNIMAVLSKMANEKAVTILVRQKSHYSATASTRSSATRSAA